MDNFIYFYFIYSLRSYNRPQRCEGRHATERIQRWAWTSIVLLHHLLSLPVLPHTIPRMIPTISLPTPWATIPQLIISPYHGSCRAQQSFNSPTDIFYSCYFNNFAKFYHILDLDFHDTAQHPKIHRLHHNF